MEKQTVGCSGFSDSLLPGETTACEVKVFQVFCGKVSAQISALNRLKNTLPLKTKESLYHAFILPYFNYCNQIWHHCRKRNTAKIEKVNERALRYIFNDKSASYQDLLERMRLPSLETRRIQDMLLTINNSISDKAPPAIRDLITLHVCSSKYNLWHDYILSLPKVNMTKYGLKSWRYFAAKKWNELANNIRIKAGTNEVKNKIRLLKFWLKSGFIVIAACFFVVLINS